MTHMYWLMSQAPDPRQTRRQRAQMGWWNWHYARGRMPMRSERQVSMSLRMVSWRRAL